MRSRSPCGERGLKCRVRSLQGKTQLSLPVRGAWVEIYDYLAGCDGAPSPKETDTLYLEISALAPSDREEVMRYARYVRANPRK